MKKLIISFFLITGCMAHNTYYFPVNHQIKKEQVNLKKINATFSVSVLHEGIGANYAEERKIIEDIRKHFQKTGFFNSFSYAFFDEKSDYHFHFDIKVTGSDHNTSGFAFLAGETLTVFPTTFHSNHDMTMSLYVDQKEVYSVTAPIHTRVIIWLPLIFLSPTAWNAGKNVREKAIKYFIHEISDKKLYVRSTLNSL